MDGKRILVNLVVNVENRHTTKLRAFQAVHGADPDSLTGGESLPKLGGGDARFGQARFNRIKAE